MESGSPIAIILAAGKGTRMGGDLPKVLYEAHNKPLLRWVVDSLQSAGIRDQIVVVGYQAEMVKKTVGGLPGISFAVQHEQRGTGDAVAAAADALRHIMAGDSDACRRPVIIVCGDSPMLRPESIVSLLTQFYSREYACLLGTAVADNPTGLGRIIRDKQGHFLKIVEEKDATDAERGICEVNMSTYVFEAQCLLNAITQLRPDNAAGEYYVTDCPGMLLEDGKLVDAVPCLDQSEALSVNTPEQLEIVATALKKLASTVRVTS